MTGTTGLNRALRCTSSTYSYTGPCTMRCLPQKTASVTLAGESILPVYQLKCVLQLQQLFTDNYAIDIANNTLFLFQTPTVLLTSSFTYQLLCCIDTPDWSNRQSGGGHTCFEYEFIYKWCVNGTLALNSEWTGGAFFNYPELNCCACGKQGKKF
ncbi:unnamed protein product [Didymodactylos carnosus]|uniref:Uncharacterized protein n=1 Tax=Didymodactylos carnosus TaxID=1234261 RepID=A0A8S2FV70_9BILA|nr:unnamed protein product [Didymodactylos carnosus]CAF4363505.1 unnamed protein product [Didymodactylos carnosus]